MIQPSRHFFAFVKAKARADLMVFVCFEAAQALVGRFGDLRAARGRSGRLVGSSASSRFSGARSC